MHRNPLKKYETGQIDNNEGHKEVLGCVRAVSSSVYISDKMSRRELVFIILSEGFRDSLGL